VRLGRDADPF